MQEEKLIVSKIEINVSPEIVWDALINPQQTKKYMYGCETVSDWKVGSSLLWNGEYNGQKMTFVKGWILKLIPNECLVYTVFDPHNKSMEDIPVNYLTVTYQLDRTEEGSLLTVTQGDYNKVAEGEKRYADSYNNGEGWSPILREIKKMLER
jgi:uncharacterized protein YndB with AHSA1/START domain